MGLGIIIQCETACRRLPRRVMAELAGRPLVDHVLSRLRENAGQEAEIVVTGLADDHDLIRWACGAELDLYRTPESDGLSSLAETAWFYELDVIVRIGAQSVFLHQPSIAPVVDRLLEGGLDYVTMLGLPEGSAPEVISRRALDALRRLGPRVTGRAPGSWSRLGTLVGRFPDRFRFAFELAPAELRRSDYSLDIELEGDLARARTLYDRMRIPEIGAFEPALEDVVAILDREPMLGAWRGEWGVLPSIPA